MFQINYWSSRSRSAAENSQNMRNSDNFRNSSWFDVQSSRASRDCPGDSKYIKIYMIFYVMSEERIWSPKTTQIVGFLKKAGHANLFANSNKYTSRLATQRLSLCFVYVFSFN